MSRADSFDRYLFIGPHPDDIELGCGALVSRLNDLGKDVCFLICTDGRYGSSNCPSLSEDEIISVRKKESLDSAHKLGVSDVRLLPFSDGGFYTDNEMRNEIAKVMGDFKPDIVFVTDPDLKTEFHPDHLRIGKIVKHLILQTAKPSIMKKYGAQTCDIKSVAFYFSSEFNQTIKSGRYFEKKLEAIFSCHVSQFPEDSECRTNFDRYLHFRKFFGKEESFRVIDKKYIHCFPEANL